MRWLACFFVFVTGFSATAQDIVLTDVSQQAGVVHRTVKADEDMPGQGGAAWFDHNNDGWFDLYLTGGDGSDAFFQNNGDGTFTEKTVEAGFGMMDGVKTNGVTTGDVDNDGYTDVFVTTFRQYDNYLFRNEGDGTFSHVENWAGSGDSANSFSAVFCDLNMDGWLDLYVGNWSRFMNVTMDNQNLTMDAERNYFYENNGDGTFTERAAEYGIDDTTGCALGIIVSDLDNDHDPDLFVANDFGFFHGNTPNRYFVNQHPITEMTEESGEVGLNVGINGMGVARADLNNDDKMDLYITNIRNDRLMMSDVTGWTDQLVERGLHNDSVWLQDMSDRSWKVGWGVGFLDLDNDMDEDLMIANGDLFYDYPQPCLDSNKLFVNDGNGYFTDVSAQVGVADTYVSRALAYCDYDLDGDLDVFVGVTDTATGNAHSFLYRNDSPEKNWFQVRAIGIAAHGSGTGSRIRIFTDGHAQMREIGGQSSFSSQHWDVAHFGLGPHTSLDSMHVIWPGGQVDRYYDLIANEMLHVEEDQSVITNVRSGANDILIGPNPFMQTVEIKSSVRISQLEVFSMDGKLVETRALNGARLRQDLGHLPAGAYLMKIWRMDGGFVMKRIIKQ